MANKPTSTAQVAAKKKKKKWIVIYASPEFNNQEIGETYVEESENAIGRVIEVNLMMLTKDPKKQTFNGYFKISEVKNNQAFTKFIGYSIQAAQLKKITRKAKNKVDDSFIYKTKDNIKIAIKPILITKVLAYKTSLKSLRKETRNFLTEYVKNTTFSQIMKDVVSNTLQREIKTACKKVLPLANCLIKTAVLEE